MQDAAPTNQHQGAGMSKAKAWTKFPYASKDFIYSGEALKKAWPKLHAGDQVVYPDKKWVEAQCKVSAEVKAATTDAAAASTTLLEAWSAYHQGQFEQACRLGESLGSLGTTVANKAEGIYASYLVDDEAQQIVHFQRCIARAETAIAEMDHDPNAHYFHAFSLGRYAQAISIMKALSQGIGGKVKASLEKAVKMAPAHAEAHIALGLYHAEIIQKVGALIGGMTYGAKADKAIEHFEHAKKLTPRAPVVYLEYANALLMLYGKKRVAEAKTAFEGAATLAPLDAMERLDQHAAQAELDG